MKYWQPTRTVLALLFAISMASMIGCGGSSDDEEKQSGPDRKTDSKADAQAWSLGNKLSLAALGHSEQAPQPAVDNMMGEAKSIAGELGVKLAPLPAQTGNRARNAAATLNYLLQTTGSSISSSLESKSGRRTSLLFQISLKTNLLLLVYSPPPNNGESRAIADFISQKATEVGLPPKLWQPLVGQVRAGVAFEQVKARVRQFQDATLTYLNAGGEGQAAKPGEKPSGQAPTTTSTIPDPPSPPSPLSDGEQYLRQLKPSSVVALPEGSEHHFDRQFEVQKVPFENGVYFCPPTERSTGRAVFDLEQGYARLKGGVAISDHRFQKAWSPVTFRIVGDGNVVWTSRPLQMCGDWESFDVDLTGVKQLTLEVACTGPHTGAHGAWMDPVLVKTQ